MIKKKIVSVFLLLSMILVPVLFASCAAKKDDGKTDTPTIAGETTASEQTETTQVQRIEPQLPDDVNYNGHNFTFLCMRYENIADWVSFDPLEVMAEQETGEPINDAVYRRNVKIEDQYGIKIKMVTNTDEASLLRKAVKADDKTYDAALIFNNHISSTVAAGLLLEVNNLPYIDMSKPWWDNSAKSMSIAGKNYLLAGDLTILDNNATNTILFNKNICENMGIELPYKKVIEGKWTLDALQQMSKEAAKDLNGDGVLTPDNDMTGFLTYNDTLHALLVSAGGALAAKNADDIPVVSFATEDSINKLQKIMDIMYDDSIVQNCQTLKGITSENGVHYADIFRSGRALFMWTRMKVVGDLRDMEQDFGILPLPKYDENQKEYYSPVNPYTGVMIGVPVNCEDTDRTSIILEALSAESRYTLQPAYYDVTLQRKYARDEESQAMLDIIFNSRVYDVGAFYAFGNCFLDFIVLTEKRNRDIMSYYEKSSAKIETAINKLVTYVETLN